MPATPVPRKAMPSARPRASTKAAPITRVQVTMIVPVPVAAMRNQIVLKVDSRPSMRLSDMKLKLNSTSEIKATRFAPK